MLFDRRRCRRIVSHMHLDIILAWFQTWLYTLCDLFSNMLCLLIAVAMGCRNSQPIRSYVISHHHIDIVCLYHRKLRCLVHGKKATGNRWVCMQLLKWHISVMWKISIYRHFLGFCVKWNWHQHFGRITCSWLVWEKHNKSTHQE